MAKTICLDFDGVMNLYTGWEGETELFQPRPGLKEFLEALKARGYEVVVHSTRAPNLIIRWLKEHGFYDLIKSVGSSKPPAIVYVDDRGLRFDGDFNVVLDAIENFKAFWEPKLPQDIKPSTP
jgi:hypothetical protein